ncbi:MAG TPA: hypothetical protein VGN88_14165 [Phycisphaerae bacterium]|jgi:hypothetical protein
MENEVIGDFLREKQGFGIFQSRFDPLLDREKAIFGPPKATL